MDHLDVAVIGAGFAGIGMGVSLKKAGIEHFKIFEKADRFGGVWRDNTYPAACCDVPSHLYSYSFQPYRDPTTRYPGQKAIQGYLEQIVDDQSLRPHLQLSTAISDARWDHDTGWWALTTAAGAIVAADEVVFAVGMLHRPYIPDFVGRDLFRGSAFHTAEWDHSQDLAGRNIAIIGTGSSAAQMLPEIAAVARRVDVYQRTANWVLPKPRTRFGPITRSAFAVFPILHSAYRAAIYLGADRILGPIMTEGWSARPMNWIARQHLRRRVPDPTLRARLTPGYRLGEKRIVVDSRYYTALNLPNVELITDPITSIDSDGIITSDQRRRDVDTIVYATGFRSTEFLQPIRITGRGGMQFHQQWADGADAYLGVAVRNFPNMWMLHGPNSFITHNSNIAIKESQIGLIVRAMLLRRQSGAVAFEIGEHAIAEYRQWLNHAMARTIWPTGVNSWYKAPRAGNSDSRITNPWPASARAFASYARRDPALTFVPLTAPRASQRARSGSIG
ncbi:flavin-containing monooxygenase [Nocardia sp. NPDC050630]|uniref:flavin-containing monooxygenase n=1 Tax=Nocardia sp. NPDC050630 TaxID=3364321 RepID=UPI00378E5CEB